MNILPTDLIVRFDEAERKIRFLVPKSPGRTEEVKNFYEVPIPLRKNRQAIAKGLGIALVAFMDATHKERFLKQQV